MPGVLYRKEREVLEFLAQFQRQHGYSPTLGEIAKATGHKSNATIHALIASLVEKGYVQKVEGNARVLKIIDQKLATTLTGNKPSIEVPLMGYISGDKPLEPHSDPNATLQISSSLISGEKTVYALEVKGDSFEPEGIFNGDYVIVEKTKESKDGDLVVVILEDSSATIKKYSKKDEKIILEPLHSSAEPLYLDSITIQGKVSSLVRKFF